MSDPTPQSPCAHCGGTEFIHGIVHAAFIPKPKGLFKGLFAFSDLAKGEVISADKCVSCSHLVLFAGKGPEAAKS